MRRDKNVMCIKECVALTNAKQVAKEYSNDNDKFRYATLYNNITKPLDDRPPKFFISPMKAAIGMNYDDFQDGYLQRDVQNHALEQIMEKEAKAAVTPNIKSHVHKMMALQQTPDDARRQPSTRVNEQTSNLMWGYPEIHKMDPESVFNRRGSSQDLIGDLVENPLAHPADGFNIDVHHRTVDGVPNQENLMTEPEYDGHEVNDYGLQEVDEDGQLIAERPQQLDTISKNCLSLAARTMLSPKAGGMPKKLNSHRLALFETDKLVKKQ